MTNTIGLVLGGFLALGLVPVMTHGFASADGLTQAQLDFEAQNKSQQDQIASIRENQLDSKIMDTRVRQCTAVKAQQQGNPSSDMAVQFATERLQDELNDYWSLTKRRYRLPDCSEL